MVCSEDCTGPFIDHEELVEPKKVKVLIGVPCLNSKDRYVGNRDISINATAKSICDVECGHLPEWL